MLIYIKVNFKTQKNNNNNIKHSNLILEDKLMSTFKFKNKVALLAVGSALSVLPATVMATNGYFSHGVGIKAKAMGGVGIAKSGDALAAGTNPANMVIVGNRVDFGIDYFTPDREVTLQGTKYEGNEDESFLIPEFGYNQMINDTMSVGVSVYGNGGMNTKYKQIIGLFSGSTGIQTGMNLEQLFIAPTFSMKVNDKNTFGVSLNVIQQKFRAYGLGNFDNAAQTSAVGFVTDNGDDTSLGFNVRLGWNMKVSDTVSLGAMYQSKADMEKFDKYRGLFAEQGDFDIPSTYGIGINVAATPAINVGFDIVKINYTDVASVSNKLGGATAGGVLNNTLGSDNGAGFGWEDMTVYKLGASFEINSQFTVLAGWNHGAQPIPAGETFFNIIAPAVVEDHYTLGLTWSLANNSELTFMYMYAPENTVKSTSAIPDAFNGGAPGGQSDLSMSQTSYGVAYGWNF